MTIFLVKLNRTDVVHIAQHLHLLRRCPHNKTNSSKRAILGRIFGCNNRFLSPEDIFLDCTLIEEGV